MVVLIIQIISSILAAYISLITIKRDFRAKTKELNKEASQIRNVVIAVTVVSILNFAVSFIKARNDTYDLKSEKLRLTNSLTRLQTQNDSLRKQLNQSTISQSKLITGSQVKSAEQLSKAADRLSTLINGSENAPLFYFIVKSDAVTDGVIRNLDSKPIYNVMFKITNYNNLLNCPITNNLLYNYSCYTENTFEIPLLPSFNAKSGQRIQLPKYNNNIRVGKYLVMVTMNNKTYYEQAIYTISDKNRLFQALRIILVKNKRVIATNVVSGKEFELKNVNWKKEFPLPLLINFSN